MASTSNWQKPGSPLAGSWGLDSPHVSPRCLSLFLKSTSVLQGEGLLSVGIYLRRSLSKRKCVALVVLQNQSSGSSTPVLNCSKSQFLHLCWQWWNPVFFLLYKAARVGCAFTLLLGSVFECFWGYLGHLIFSFFPRSWCRTLLCEKWPWLVTYALSFNLLVPSETNFLHFTWHAKVQGKRAVTKKAETGPPRPRGAEAGWISGVGCQLHKRVSGWWAVAVLGLLRCVF